MWAIYRAVCAALRRLDDERIRFVVVGGWNTLFGYLSFAAVHLVSAGRIGPITTLVLAYVIALPQAFIGQKLFVFRRASGAWVAQFARFTLVNSTTFLANAALLAVGSRIWPERDLLLQAVVVIGLTIVSFVAHKTFSFTERR